MVKLALLVRLEAKSGNEQQVADFIKGALAIAQREPGNINWYALQLGASTFGNLTRLCTKEAERHILGDK